MAEGPGGPEGQSLGGVYDSDGDDDYLVYEPRQRMRALGVSPGADCID